MVTLVENLRAAYAERVKQLPWMTEDTKKAALEKLATFRPKIGYPDKWRDYSDARDARRRRVRQLDSRDGVRLESRRRTASASRRIATSGA